MLSSSSSSSLSSVLSQLPTELLLDNDVFEQVLVEECIWDKLSHTKRQELIDKFLPHQLTQTEKEDTIDLLLNKALTRFNREALGEALAKLKLQKMSPEVVRAVDEVKMLKQRLAKLYEQKRQCRLLNEVLEQRMSLVKSSLSLDGTLSSSQIKKKPSRALILRERARIRYKREIKEFDSKADSTSDEEEDMTDEASSCSSEKTMRVGDKMPVIEKDYHELLRKHRRKRKAIESDSSLYEPMFETSDITLNDIIFRVTNCSTFAPSLLSSKKSPQASSISGKTLDSLKKRAKHSNNQKLSQNNLNMNNGHSSSQSPNRVDVESDLSNKSDNNAAGDNNAPAGDNGSEVKNEADNRPDSSRLSSCQQTDSNVSCLSSAETRSPESPVIAASLPVLPPLLSSSPEPSPVQISFEKPPSCFFSLLRDIFNSNAINDHRLTLHKLEEHVKEKLRCFDPVTGWTTEMVGSALNYLSGLPPPHLIPLVDYKEKNQQWQWIGKERDLDVDLVPLCEDWMRNRDEETNNGIISLSQAVPPAKCITTWTVRPSSEEEKLIYRQQEAVRYNNPNKAFTYRVHGYESVVGPVKGCGIGNCNVNNNSSPNKAREHSLLVNDRPPFVTLLSLVRDAAARLPNGEGTRADICELLKDSQYLLPTISDHQVNGIVSGALDRLHYEKDPCVKYDVNRKVWIYLHRNRSEAEFERLHEVQIAAAKAKRSMNKSSRRSSANSSNNIQSGLQKQNQLPIISKTTQQAIHQVVTNILNSEALKVPSNPVANSVPVPKATTTLSISTNTTTNINLIQSKLNSALTGRFAVNSFSRDEESSKDNLNDSSSQIQVNGVLPTQALSSEAVIVSYPPTDESKIKTQFLHATTNQLPNFAKSLQEDMKVRIEPKINPIVHSMSTSNENNRQVNVNVSQNSSLNSTSSTLTNLLTNKSNDYVVNKANPNPKVRTLKQAKPALKIELPKTITLPISLQNQQSQTTLTSINTTDNLSSLITMANSASKPNVVVTTAANSPFPKMMNAKIAFPTQIAGSQNLTNTAHQISIPTSVLFGARPGSVVLATPTGKSYMMAAAGGSIMLQQNPSSPTVNSLNPSTSTPSLAVRTLQGIRVIPVATNAPTSIKTNLVNSPQCNAQTIVTGQQQPVSTTAIPGQHQLVARIIATTQPNRAVQQTQIVIPSTSALQPLFLAHPQQGQQTTSAIVQQIQPQSQLQKPKLAITIPPRTSS